MIPERRAVLPCPCCRNEASEVPGLGVWIHDHPENGWIVRCRCGMRTEGSASMLTVIETWNRRPNIARETAARHTGFPDYCPDGLREDEVCPDCGASAENLLACGARFNGPKPKPLVALTVVKR